MTFRYLDICSGISAPTMAWRELGWQCAAYSEIENFPRAVLAARYGAVPADWDHRHTPGSNVTPLFGDFTRIEAHHVGPIDLLVGGTPCQDFSVAGLRAGLDGDRGNLSLEYLRLADRTRPRWLVWENVPGVLSIDGGRAFGAILGGMGELGYGFAYRVFDAQHAGVPQRRRRVFVVGYTGNWRRAAAVLFERHSLSRNTPPRREARQDVARPVARSLAIRGRDGTPQAELGDEVANAILTPSGGRAGIGVGAVMHSIAPTIPARTRGGGGLGTDFDCDGGLVPEAYQTSGNCGAWMTGDVTGALDTGTDPNSIGVLFPVTIQAGATRENPDSGPDGIGVRSDGLAYTLEARAECQAVAFNENQQGVVWESDTAQALNKGGGKPGQGYAAIREGWAVRRLSPVECHRLQGFPDDHCAITYRGKPAADGPQYKALGNSMAVPDVRWIGERIAMVDALSFPLSAVA